MKPSDLNAASNAELKAALANGDADFWPRLSLRSRLAGGFDDLLFLSTLRRRAEAKGLAPEGEKLRLALIGGCNLYPLHELVGHMLSVSGYSCELFVGEFDTYVTEMLDESGALYGFRPDLVFVIPSEGRCRYEGRLTDARERPQAQAVEAAGRLLDLCRTFHERTRAEIILANFILPAGFDPGAYRTRTLGSDWNFRKLVNTELGLSAPRFVHVCDMEFLAYRRGALDSRDDRAWFESKQPCAPDLLVDVAKEVAHLASSLRRAPKKVLALDLDNTLWGGVVGDDGLEGIEVGDTSPRGEAFKAFQKYVLSLAERGVLLAVCSKNDYERAVEPFEKHPEMVLRPKDFVSFKADWNPKSDNLRAMAAELGLGLDSIVFVDDNPAEIEIVRQFAPEVTTVLVGPDPADYVRQLQDVRLFEPSQVTPLDSQRAEKFRREAERKVSLTSSTDMASYLESLEMVGRLTEFNPLDAPRIAQLI
ncbi:MAG: HAD-IIIC family phosphatase, partial [Pyrinomonadaceae bacterium]